MNRDAELASFQNDVMKNNQNKQRNKFTSIIVSQIWTSGAPKAKQISAKNHTSNREQKLASRRTKANQTNQRATTAIGSRV